MSYIKSFAKKINIIRKIYYKTNRGYTIVLTKISPVLASKRLYKKSFGRSLDLDKPKGFNEKLMWLKLYWQNSLVSKCADKFTVREYAKECGCEYALNNLYGVYNTTGEIDWDNIPNKFALKCTHGCGFNIICDDKSRLDKEKVFDTLNKWMKIDYSLFYAELQYANITPRIICERYLETGSGYLPDDYKIFCFNGEPMFTMVCHDRDTGTPKYYFYGKNWELLPYNKWSKETKERIDKPAVIDEMIELSKILANPFPFVRTDFYDYNGKAIIGEMTFTPAGCLDSKILPDAEAMLGNLIDLPPK